MNDKILILSEKDIQEILERHLLDINAETEKALLIEGRDKCILPDKISQIFDVEAQTRINCMPATLLSEAISGVKWVSVFPTNAAKGLKNVSGTILLSEINTGKLLSVCSAALLTSIRTAAVGAVAAKYLAPRQVFSIGFIGAGEEAKNHLIQIKKMFPMIRECRVASRTRRSEMRFLQDMSVCFPGVRFVSCEGNYEKAVNESDIVITATSSQEKILKREWIKEGSLYIHVGGVEDEYSVAENADKIVCDDWEAVKHRAQTISKMYQEGMLSDQNIYGNLREIIQGKKAGREDNKEFIYFNSVGLATIDIYLAYQFLKKAQEEGIGMYVENENIPVMDYRKYV